MFLGDSFLGAAPDRGAFEADPRDLNRPPVATPDQFDVENDGEPKVLPVLTNDSTEPDSGETMFIVGATGGDHGGTVAVGPGGRWIVFTPAAGYSGPESFDYTLSDSRGGTSTGHVTLGVQPQVDDVATIYPVFTDSSGKPIDAIAVGETFNVTFYARDLREPELGVFSAYTDGFFDFTRAMPVGPIEPGSLFPFGRDGNLDTEGVIDEGGGFSHAQPPEPVGPELMFTVTMRATASGMFLVIADPADVIDWNHVVLYDEMNITPTSRVRYEDAALRIAERRPVANDDRYSLLEDAELNIEPPSTPLANDQIGDGTTLVATLVDGPAHGTLQFDADGRFNYTPDPDFFGEDRFTYQVRDGVLDSNVATVVLTVAAVNDAPVANDDRYSLLEDAELNVTARGVLGNDVDVDGDALSAVLVTPPAHGTLELKTDGSFRYRPQLNYNGGDFFEYRVDDGTTSSAIARVDLTIDAVNDAPVAPTLNVWTAEDTEVAFSLTADDGDPETTQSLSFILTTLPAHGRLSRASGGAAIEAGELPLRLASPRLYYRPTDNWSGDDTLTFIAQDDGGTQRNGVDTSGQLTVSLHVAPQNDAPVGVDDGYRVGRDNRLSVDASHGVLANDSDVDGATLTARLIAPPASGALTLNTDGSFVYTPVPGFDGVVTFRYRASDGSTESSDVTATIVVSKPRLDVRLIVTDSAGRPVDRLVEGHSFQVTMTATDLSTPTTGPFAVYADIDFDAAIAAVNGPITFGSSFANAHSGSTAAAGLIDELGAAAWVARLGAGTFVVATIPLVATRPGQVAFTSSPADLLPEHDSLLTGDSQALHFDEIRYSADTLTVLPRVTAADDSLTIDEDSGTTTLDVLANDQFGPGVTITLTLTGAASHGQAVVNPDGRSVSYVPAADYFGSDLLRYTLTDENGTSDEAVVAIDVRPVNDPPRAVDDRVTVVEDSRDVRLAPLANDDFAPDAPETLRIVAVSAG
ncbi:MAG TPA: Ig-like domain-containing protein, partial [Pirellulaceae bacterium]|nr:Ig-like domain-containing protein [Pirellulaceae bacterium]